MNLKKLTPAEWSVLSETAHLLAFNENKPAHFDRIDFALLVEEDNKPLAYLTAREMDHETVYWQFGGAFPTTRGTIKSFHAYSMMTAWSKEHYKRVVTLIENDNLAMLKFAMKVGFRIQGVKIFKANVLLEHVLEFV